MDITRPDLKVQKRCLQIILNAVVVHVIVGATIGASAQASCSCCGNGALCGRARRSATPGCASSMDSAQLLLASQEAIHALVSITPLVEWTTFPEASIRWSGLG